MVLPINRSARRDDYIAVKFVVYPATWSSHETMPDWEGQESSSLTCVCIASRVLKLRCIACKVLNEKLLLSGAAYRSTTIWSAVSLTVSPAYISVVTLHAKICHVPYIVNGYIAV